MLYIFVSLFRVFHEVAKISALDDLELDLLCHHGDAGMRQNSTPS